MLHGGLPVMKLSELTEAERRLIEASQKSTQTPAAGVPPKLGSAGAGAPVAAPPGSAPAAAASHGREAIEINDLPDPVRLRIMAKKFMTMIENEFKVSVTVHGNFIPPNRAPNVGERKIHLMVESSDAVAVRKAVAEINRHIQVGAVQLTVDQATKHMSAMTGGVGGTQRYRI